MARSDDYISPELREAVEEHWNAKQLRELVARERAAKPEDKWAVEREDVLQRFSEELSKATGDGSRKRQSGGKPPWYEDDSHEAAIHSHFAKWKRGELVDLDSGTHPLVHAAWRCLAIACRESGNTPDGG